MNTTFRYFVSVLASVLKTTNEGANDHLNFYTLGKWIYTRKQNEEHIGTHEHCNKQQAVGHAHCCNLIFQAL